MKNLELPITYPPVASFPCHAFYLSVMSNHKSCLPWMYSHYLQYAMYFGDDFILPDYIVPHPEYHYNSWFYSHSQRLVRSTVLRTAPDQPGFVQFLKGALDDGYYVYMHVDEFYIPNCASFQNKRFPHAIMLYGYNDDESSFNTAGFFNFASSSKYAFSKVSYSQVYQSFIDCEIHSEYLNFMHLYKLNPKGHNGYVPGFDMPYIIQSIDDFLSSRCSFALLEIPPFAPVRHFAYGLQTYAHLKEALEIGLFDNRTYFLVWEHKNFMLQRIKYMGENGYLNMPESLFQEYKQIETEAEICLKLLFKYSLSNDRQILKRVQQKLDHMQSMERAALENIMEQLQRKSSFVRSDSDI